MAKPPPRPLDIAAFELAADLEIVIAERDALTRRVAQARRDRTEIASLRRHIDDLEHQIADLANQLTAPPPPETKAPRND